MPLSSSDTRFARILDRTRVHDGKFAIDRYRIRHSTPAGGDATVTREIFERGHSAALLCHDPEADTVLVIEEFRAGRLAAGMVDADCWSTGVIAGMIDPGENDRTTILREAREEAGIEITEGDLIGPITVFNSPGGSSETTALFLAMTRLDPKHLSGDANVGAGEYTEPKIISRKDALSRLLHGPVNAHSTTLLLWLEQIRAEHHSLNGD